MQANAPGAYEAPASQGGGGPIWAFLRAQRWRARLPRPQPRGRAGRQAVLRRLLEAPARVRRMQDALALHQRLFIWAAGAEGGVLASLERELAIRAGHLADGPQLALT